MLAAIRKLPTATPAQRVSTNEAKRPRPACLACQDFHKMKLVACHVKFVQLENFNQIVASLIAISCPKAKLLEMVAAAG